MVTLRSLRWAAAAVFVVAALTVAGCGTTAEAGASPDPSASTGASTGIVLRVESVGGFVPAALNYTRVPIVSIYADGRVLAEGPVPAIYPGPALPNILVRRIARSDVDRLIARARSAGVGAPTDFGTPGIADATSTRFTLHTGGDTRTTDVYALGETTDADHGLTRPQRAARTRMRSLLGALTDLPTTLGAHAAGTEHPYRATAVAALARPWTSPGPGPQSPPVAWPGAALPGSPLGPADVRCATTTGAAAERVLATGARATSITPWTYGGRRWSLTLRPLLPDEHTCGDLSH